MGAVRLASLGVAATAGLASDLLLVAAGRGAHHPDPGDRRFQDPAWTTNPAYRRLGQAYAASCAAVDEVVAGLELAGQRHTAERVRLLGSLATSAVAPTNTLLGNPAALKRAIDTGGLSLLSGSLHAVDDLRHNGGLPSMVPRASLRVGTDLALTRGDVVQRDEVAELLRYAPSTESVRERPLLVVPPMIGRYYFLDLRPGRSFVEHAVDRGLQTYLLSWRNPTHEQRDWSIDTYVARVDAAVEAICEETGSADVNVVGFCAGGILTSLLLAHHAAVGSSRVHSASFAVTMLDFGAPIPLTALVGDRTLRASRWLAERRGVRSAEATGRALTWMRPDDLVWNYWVNNYLMGQEPPEFDILTWNADGTNLPAALYRDFLELIRRNPLVEPGALEVLGSRIDLSQVTIPTFVAGAVADHLTPWRQTYRTGQLLGGESVFALSSAGHIASLVNPPGNPRASYSMGPVLPGETAEQWQQRAASHQGSWWEAWAAWVLERSGPPRPPGERAAPGASSLGTAPGRYVREKVRRRVRSRPGDSAASTLVSSTGLAYSVAGSGPPLLCISGYNAPTELLEPFVAPLRERFTCITYDLRGCGRTELAPTTLSVRAMAADACDVLDSAGVGAAHVLGFSLGGMVAQELALLAPERVRSLVLAATTAGGLDADYAPPPIELGVELVRTASRLGSLRVDLRVALTQAWAAGTHDTTSRLPSVLAPTLVVHGEDDRLLRVGNAHQIASLVPGADLATIPGAGHLFFLDSDEGLERISAWLEVHRDAEAPRDATADAGPTGAAALLRNQLLPSQHAWKAMRNRARQAVALAQAATRLPG